MSASFAIFPNGQVISLDHRVDHLHNAASPRVVADALRLPFQSRAFDFVLCVSVLHHFRNHEVIEMIAGLRPFAPRALLLLDLERHALAYWFIPLTRHLLKWSPLTLHDGPISVASAFRLDQLVSLAYAAGASEIVARRHRPWFRVSLTIPTNASWKFTRQALQDINLAGQKDDRTGTSNLLRRSG